jgi:hypothetical protein
MEGHEYNKSLYLNAQRSANMTAMMPESPINSRQPWYWIVRGLIALVTIFGNGFVIYLISARQVLREQASPNWFVMSMAVADFCVGAVNFPLNMLFAFTASHQAETPLHWTILGFFMNIFLDASVTNLSLLTLDRYLAVVHPFTYETFMNPSRAYLLIIVAWGVAIILEIPYLVLDLQHASNEAYYVNLIMYMVIFAFLPSFFMLYSYARILCVARRHKLKIKKHKLQIASNNPSNRRMTQSGNKNGALVAVGTIVGIFLLCNSAMQYHLTCFISPSCEITNTSFYVFLLLRYLNSTPNFIIYAFMKKDFRRELRKSIRRRSFR